MLTNTNGFVTAVRSGGGARDGFSIAPAGEENRRFGIEGRERAISVGAGIAFDAAADAVQPKIKDGQFGVGFSGSPDPPRVEDERVFARQAGAALAAQVGRAGQWR